MAEVKHIVNELTKVLDIKLNMITFDALGPEGLLQLLVDLLVKLKAMEKFDVKETAPEETIRKILDGLKRIQYQPKDSKIDPVSFQRQLLEGDKKLIYPIFSWIFENKDFVNESSYLARFLMPLNLPPEALSIPDISNLYGQYQAVVNDFIDTHKSYKTTRTEGSQLVELKHDIEAIEMEMENVKKRIEKTQSRLDKVPQQELFLESGKGLRIEKDRNRELQAQLEEQKHCLQKSFIIHERLQKELNSCRLTMHSTTPKQLLESVDEEANVLEFMVQSKLPNELLEMQRELDIYQEIMKEPNINKSYLDDAQMKVDAVSQEIQHLLELKLGSSQNDSLLPFRQQANSVAKNKEAIAEHLNQLTKERRELETKLQAKQLQIQETVGDVVLRGEELKQYVNMLRTKSSLYKQKKAELAVLKADANDLMHTFDNLKSQDPSINVPQSEEDASDSMDPVSLEMAIDGQSIGDLSRMVDGLERGVKMARERLAPLSSKIRPLREKVTELKEEKERKKQSHDALNATLTSENVTLESQLNETLKEIAKQEEKWRDIQLEQEHIETLIEKAREDDDGKFKISLKDALEQNIRDQEAQLLRLKQDYNLFSSNKEDKENQEALWSDLGQLLQVKLKCCLDQKSKGLGGTMKIDRGAETFTLQ